MLNREDYMLVIWEYLEAFDKVQEKDISNRLHISPPTVYEYLLKLQEEGIISRNGRNIEFTQSGKNIALKLIRMHRISEVFAYKFLEIPWEDVHVSVMELEHLFSGSKGEALYKNLGRPETCPHGNPINPEYRIKEIPLPFADDGRYHVRRVSFEEIGLLKKLASIGAIPDQEVYVIKDADDIELTGPNGTMKIEFPVAMSLRLYL